MVLSWDHRKFQILVRGWKVPANSYFSMPSLVVAGGAQSVSGEDHWESDIFCKDLFLFIYFFGCGGSLLLLMSFF